MLGGGGGGELGACFPFEQAQVEANSKRLSSGEALESASPPITGKDPIRIHPSKRGLLVHCPKGYDGYG